MSSERISGSRIKIKKNEKKKREEIKSTKKTLRKKKFLEESLVSWILIRTPYALYGLTRINFKGSTR